MVLVSNDRYSIIDFEFGAKSGKIGILDKVIADLGQSFSQFGTSIMKNLPSFTLMLKIVRFLSRTIIYD